MNYLQSLKAEKAARESYQNDELKLKELIFKITNYHSVYDGEFLEQLELFINNFKIYLVHSWLNLFLKTKK